MEQIKLIVTPEDYLIIQKGLLELPAKKSYKILNKLCIQVNAQIEKNNKGEIKENGN